jgi:hypothetical protein
MKTQFTQIDNIITTTNFAEILNNLNKLNTALKQILPTKFIQFCHVGAYIDDTVFIYVDQQPLLYLLNNFLENILTTFNRLGYSFNKVSLKVRPFQEKDTKSTPKIYSPETITKLTDLAKLIGREDMVAKQQEIKSTPPFDDEL